jgi:hypothetical protein
MDFQINYPKSTVQSKFGLNYKMAFILAILTIAATVGLAQPATTSTDEPSTDVNTTAAPSFPYVAEITGNDVYIRSGPGTNFYSCGKLYKGDRVEVVSTQFGWSRIVPPAGSFSWISMQYVSSSLDDPTVGIVTGDVSVYAGSEGVKPMHSTYEQIRLKRGDKVKLLGEERDDYYKIAPPSGAYLWVSTQYTKPASPVIEGTLPSPVITDANTTAPTIASVEQEKLKEFYALQEKIKIERAKPIDQQNYMIIKKALKDIADNKNAGKASRYAEFVIKQIDGFELAGQVAKEIQLQKTQLQKVMEGIDKARATKLAKLENLGRFIVIGKFQTFETYGPGHFRIVDESSKMLCYALPSGQLLETDLSKFIGKKVGLIGTTEPHPATAGALVKFTEIVDLESRS